MASKRPIPETAVVNGETWRVHHTKRRPKWVSLESDDDDDMLGMCDPRERRIWVRNIGQSGNEKKTCLHELIHAWLHAACRRNDSLKLVINGDTEEAIAGALEDVIWSYVRENSLRWLPLREEGE